MGEGAKRVTTPEEVFAGGDIEPGGGGKAAPLSTAFARLPTLAGLCREVAAQGERWTLWSPVAFGFGAAAYLNLKAEPPLWPVLFGATLFAAAVLAIRRRVARPALLIPLVLLAFGAGAWRRASCAPSSSGRR